MNEGKIEKIFGYAMLLGWVGTLIITLAFTFCDTYLDQDGTFLMLFMALTGGFFPLAVFVSCIFWGAAGCFFEYFSSPVRGNDFQEAEIFLGGVFLGGVLSVVIILSAWFSIVYEGSYTENWVALKLSEYGTKKAVLEGTFAVGILSYLPGFFIGCAIEWSWNKFKR